ncbi:tRNA (guanosine(46)-N7)-methyltransferase TrmB [Salinisphaera sp. Q1T1-3]|uniref:tRNA (guanosine(46)-N7)-methyltransferase TrmB n=1 Tax=Salinisphaera sp. Q1T1-3 TaxID=2321229 RepID=UPI000E757CAC|nr:tRNA (guanosine(46)-N7)-methyltransferase TrmB [Salinisphaera sp. Q1T1-3]RJS91214.1 tRNA (guanosine(46)-N7)-methyltransferase TrmB [Salinisphaera sp. Q1T1-3]
MTDSIDHPRRIRSFVKREGRLTPSQERNLAALWPRYGRERPAAPIDWPHEFGRDAHRTLEIGFGAGEVLADLAIRRPEADFIGIEVYRNGVGRLLGALDEAEADNVRVFRDDAVEVLAGAFADASLDEVLLYFPDPWPKKKHHKRRIVQPGFADEIARVLRPGGIWRLATDWINYAEHMRDVLDAHAAFENIGDTNGYVTAPPRRDTRFENRGLNKGHLVHDMAYQKRSTPP